MSEPAELEGLTDFFDDDLAKSILEIYISRTVNPMDVLAKSLYNFDLETPEGVDRLLELLPILDPEVMKEVYQEIFPGYPVDDLAPRLMRVELRGYLMDYMESNGQEANQPGGEKPAGIGGGSPEVQEPSQPGPAEPAGPGEEDVSAEPQAPPEPNQA